MPEKVFTPEAENMTQDEMALRGVLNRVKEGSLTGPERNRVLAVAEELVKTLKSQPVKGEVVDDVHADSVDREECVEQISELKRKLKEAISNFLIGVKRARSDYKDPNSLKGPQGIYRMSEKPSNLWFHVGDSMAKKDTAGTLLSEARELLPTVAEQIEEALKQFDGFGAYHATTIRERDMDVRQEFTSMCEEVIRSLEKIHQDLV